MAGMLSINIGYVTNSSSVVYHFPKTLLEDKNIQAFIRAFEIEDGFVGPELWSRNTCGTFAITRAQKEETLAKLTSEDGWSHPAIHVDDESTVVVVIGDEHEDIAKVLAGMLRDLAEKNGLAVSSDDYN